MSTVMMLSMPKGAATAGRLRAEAGPELMALTARRRMISPTASPPLDWK